MATDSKETNDTKITGTETGSEHAEPVDPIAQWEEEVRAEADAHGVVAQELPPYFDPRHRLVRLQENLDSKTGAADSESLLNALLSDCHSLIREVAFQTARLTPDPDIRLRSLTAAQTLLLAGAKVGEAVATMKASQKPGTAETRHRMIIEDNRSILTPIPTDGSPIKAYKREYPNRREEMP